MRLDYSGRRCLGVVDYITRPARYGIKSMWPLFKTEMLIYQSKANLDEKILFGKLTHHLRSNNQKNPCKGFAWESKIPRSILVFDLCSIEVYVVSFRNRF